MSRINHRLHLWKWLQRRLCKEEGDVLSERTEKLPGCGSDDIVPSRMTGTFHIK